ncbi:putative isomerase YbhE [Cryphonectria parasitica EP155]|uniref:Isomerase YbhE n=1 Tax=Cryphonectria parasitica (strain ATCC 38755 / EP155) TaxID=660469 RepID=A0A9P5CN99_CRYP1|nr:putative isomerase YbhE [Cryphonectria parasitica EP155]KAF3765229.1 putative isomerase YbhE [Cryphonectria parasitica EP155]
MIGAADFDGESFDIVAHHTIAGTSASWLLFKEPNLLYAVDENSNTTRLFNFDPDTNALKLVQNATGSSGVVSLQFNRDKSVMIGAAFVEGQIDIWDLDERDGTMKLRKQIPAGGEPGPVAGRQDSPHPHEALLDPTGQFFVVPDLGTDALLVIDTKDFEIQNRIRISPSGSGPRHGSFFPLGGHEEATHFFIACEITNLIKVFELKYTGDGLGFHEVQSLSTFGDEFPPANPTTASAGELVIDADNKNLYVSNRLTGDATDNISHFSIDSRDRAPLRFVDQISSGGVLPRMFSISKDDDILFSTNQDGEDGLLAFAKDKSTGSLAEKPLARIARDKFGKANFGPQFVMEI